MRHRYPVANRDPEAVLAATSGRGGYILMTALISSILTRGVAHPVYRGSVFSRCFGHCQSDPGTACRRITTPQAPAASLANWYDASTLIPGQQLPGSLRHSIPITNLSFAV